MATDGVGSGLPWVDAISAAFPRYDFADFHTTALPLLNTRRGARVADDLAGAPPLAFRLGDGRSFTWVPAADGVRVVEGHGGAATLVDLDEDTFSEYLHELLTASGAVRTGRARVAQGDLEGWKRWQPATRTLLTGRPIYTGAVRETLIDGYGAPLDLHRSFPADGDRTEMRHFLRTAGYLHITGVYSPDEVAELSAGVQAARAATTPGDPYSWWSLNADGEEVVTRINYVGRYSEVVQQHCFEPRMTGYARLVDPNFRVCDDRLDGPMVFIKNPGVVKGDGDLGWHVDDGIGGHPVLCPLIQAGVQLDHANAANGQLMVMPGSHRYTKHWPSWGAENDVPVVHLETEPGDLTLHFGDIMHSTPPPTAPDAGRRVLYYKFCTDTTFRFVPAGCHYNDALFRADAAGKVSARASTY